MHGDMRCSWELVYKGGQRNWVAFSGKIQVYNEALEQCLNISAPSNIESESLRAEATVAPL